ncbi:DUF6083 domain-containing protein [Streptomyces ossamyceticus]|uniref:DUF6083 domain-containing protein n=1 Tax=Streptomyces ossamyceticus TaxID=249581 RepID=UPI00099E7C46|nr:DUF6083 domain-containing protein [Streptomyces ossamyceticus]
MRSRPSSSLRHWDGSPVAVPVHRSLRVAPTGGSRLLRCGQGGRCRECGNRIEWYQRTDQRMVRLHPHELPAARVPAGCRWHVSSGIAHPAGDSSSWCRIPHALLCPARDTPAAAAGLSGLRRALAVHTRRMIDTGAFTPPASQPARTVSQPAACRPARPVVQLLYVRYLAACPIEAIRCVARTRRRDRCPRPLLTADAPAGTWTLVPATAAPAGQLALPAEVMAVYDLSPLPYSEQLRWRSQRCPQHAASPTVPDLAVADWEPFDPLIHHEHIHARLPTGGRRGPSSRGRKTVRP